MFKFLKRLRGKKEEPKLQPEAVATEVVPAPVVEAPVAPPEPATEVPASVTAIDPNPEEETSRGDSASVKHKGNYR